MRRTQVLRLFTILLIAISMVVMLVVTSASAAPAQQATCTPGAIIVVQGGETLFRIALRYNTTVNALAAANNISNINLVYAGQRLLIACSTTNTATITPTPSATLRPTASATPYIVVLPGGGMVNCSNFRATSPTDGFLLGENIFYWNPAPGALAYVVNVYNLDQGGRLAQQVQVPPTQTSVNINVNETAAGQGFRFAWEVQAIGSQRVQGGTLRAVPACTTPRVSLLRQARIDSPLVLPAATPSATGLPAV